jgi:hypothetical protein
VNHELIASGKPTEHMNAVGGEEPFWLGLKAASFLSILKKERV